MKDTELSRKEKTTQHCFPTFKLPESTKHRLRLPR